MKKVLILFSLIISGFYISQAINLNLSSGEVLSNSSWQEVSNITGKIKLNSSDINISGKLVSSGKICVGNSCLGECSAGNHWDSDSLSCEPNNCSAEIITDNGHNYSVPDINNGSNSGVLTSTNYDTITNGKKYYTRNFTCNNGFVETTGSEGNNIVCDDGYTASGENCVFSCPSSYSGQPTISSGGTCFYRTGIVGVNNVNVTNVGSRVLNGSYIQFSGYGCGTTTCDQSIFATYGGNTIRHCSSRYANTSYNMCHSRWRLYSPVPGQ